MDDKILTSSQTDRRRDLAALGNFVVLGLIFFHTSQIFSPFGLFIKNAPPSFEDTNQLAAAVFTIFVTLWGMPLMFLIAGMAVWFSLHKRTAAEFTRERLRRLLLPFLVGFLIFTPFNQYIVVLHQFPHEAGTYLQFLRAFFHIEFDLGSPLFIKGTSPFYTMSHMWFLIYLFGYSMLLLPLFLFARRPAGRRILDRFASLLTRPWAVYLMAAPLALIQGGLGVPDAAVSATWNLLAYLIFLAYGFLFAADSRFEQAARRHRKSALLLGILGFILYSGGNFGLNAAGSGLGLDIGLGYILLRFVQGVTGWFWILAIIGLASSNRHKLAESLSPKSTRPALRLRILDYIAEAQLPFYILHMTPIVLAGYFVVQWEIGGLVKYIVIVLASLAGTFILYDIVVRRTRLTRFLFGLRPGPPKEQRTFQKSPLARSQMPEP
jgi:hypothetical protein